jgi:hypothetical protein
MQLKNKVRLWQNLVEIGKHFDIFSFQKLNNYTNSRLLFSNLENVQGEGLKFEPRPTQYMYTSEEDSGLKMYKTKSRCV